MYKDPLPICVPKNIQGWLTLFYGFYMQHAGWGSLMQPSKAYGSQTFKPPAPQARPSQVGGLSGNLFNGAPLPGYIENHLWQRPPYFEFPTNLKGLKYKKAGGLRREFGYVVQHECECVNWEGVHPEFHAPVGNCLEPERCLAQIRVRENLLQNRKTSVPDICTWICNVCNLSQR